MSDLPYHHDWKPQFETSLGLQMKWFGRWGGDPVGVYVLEKANEVPAMIKHQGKYSAVGSTAPAQRLLLKGSS